MDVRPGRSLGLLSVAHAVNHAFAVLLPLIFLAIIDEFGVSVQDGRLPCRIRVARRRASCSSATPSSPATSRAGACSGSAACCSAAASPRWPLRRASRPSHSRTITARIGGSPQHPVGNGLLAEQFPPERRGFAISAHIAGGNVGTVVVAIVGSPAARADRMARHVDPVRRGRDGDRPRDPGARPRARDRPRGGSCRWQQHRRVAPRPRRSRPALGVPDLDPGRRWARAGRRQPVRADLPDARHRPRRAARPA